MAKIRHIALASAHPGKAAEFFKQAFGFKELGRFGLDPARPEEAPRPSGVFLTDGTINFAILKAGKANLAGMSEDFLGIHHFGIVIDDMDSYTKKLESMGVPCVGSYDAIRPGAHKEIKFRGPDGVIFDITDQLWPGSE
jgi:catechol 2,3-dioxygenase-like lactoylglutathione lyase family enzyme